MTSAQTRRDAALRRLAKANRWIAAAAVVATGALTEVVAHAFSGHTIAKPGTKGRTPQSQSEGRHARQVATAARRRHRRRLHAAAAPAPVGPAPTAPAPVRASTAPAAAPTAPAPVAPAPAAPAPAPAPVVSGGS
jgi:2-oxoglutarate dehydrogenase E2 component (dihydrolipoamide succinyltransferase)